MLEHYLRKRYRSEEETTYIAQRDKFFQFIHEASDPDLVEFCKKHLSVVNNKSPGLKAFILKAMEEISKLGFRIETDFAEKINKRRGQLLHSLATVDDFNILDIYDETLVMAAILTLLTLKDFGADISKMAERPNSLTDLRRVVGKRAREQR